MRRTFLFNDGWTFEKEGQIQQVTIPHTWNAVDGQDGGNDYYRGLCTYRKEFPKPDISGGERVILRFGAVNSTAGAELNGKKLGTHKGGYSAFSFDITDALLEENELVVTADNSENEEVYPQRADFTFYGGIYRDVTLTVVSAAHFSLREEEYKGMKITPIVAEDGSAKVSFEIFTHGAEEGSAVRIALKADGVKVTELALDIDKNGQAKGETVIEHPHLWDGLSDPFLYDVEAALFSGGKETDAISTRIGIRNFSIDPQKGFLLNGREYPLIGAAAHQDRRGVGNAITPEMLREDIDLILEMGCNVIRAAHYQHEDAFYDLCDEKGIVVWAEIPYITQQMDGGQENALSQLKELITQQYNHPSIICWALSNEITIAGGVKEGTREDHKKLNALAHQLDATRPTAAAHAFMLDPEDPFRAEAADVCTYNLYYGWYVGNLEDNDKFFDSFHKKHPDTPIGLSEYGADALICFQSAEPDQGDNSEQYQALYHEHLLKMREERPYIWLMSVWNMFDFAADGRNDEGEKGVNHKGLVTFDRKIKKDAFYLYKAYLSEEKFVHLCGSRYINRAEEVTEVKVYSNEPVITLYVDGKETETKSSEKIFTFRVPISGEHTIEARAEDGQSDSITICKVAERDKSYMMTSRQLLNWFDNDQKEGFFSVNDKMTDIMKNPKGAAVMGQLMAQARKQFGDVAEAAQASVSQAMEIPDVPLLRMLQRISSIGSDQIRQLNDVLQQIPKN